MLTGKNNEEKIWNYLTAAGLSACGAAGLMGNLYAESALSPTNLQNTFENRLGYTDASYTAAVDSGTYTNFAKDGAGYGLAQWTYWSRKEALLAFAKSVSASVGSLDAQLGFLMKELSESYKTVLTTLKAAAAVREASDAVLTQFERPADQSEAVKTKRAGYGQTYYDKYVKGENRTMSNSALVTYTKISPNRTSPRTHAIDTITIHCIVGQWTAKQGCDYFAASSVQAAPNYVVGKDGSIGLCVEEKDRSWCSSNPANDHRAVTIEVASDTTSPYAVTNAAYNALIELAADVCKRNGIRKLLWKGDKALVGKVDQQNMTVHRWFANKDCPGDYLYARYGDIAAKVNAKLGTGAASSGSADTTAGQTNTAASAVKVDSAKYRLDALAGAYKTTSDLNLRAGAGTAKAVLTVVPKGGTVRNYGYYNELDGRKWLYVQYTTGGKTYTGYCSSAYLVKG